MGLAAIRSINNYPEPEPQIRPSFNDVQDERKGIGSYPGGNKSAHPERR